MMTGYGMMIAWEFFFFFLDCFVSLYVMARTVCWMNM